jgi:hypothetical protein
VGDVIATPNGPVVFIDAGGVEPRLILEIISDHLAGAGVHDATIRFPDRTVAVGALDHVPRCVVVRLYVAPPRLVSVPGVTPEEWIPNELPEAWIDAAASWVTEGRDPAEELWVQRSVVEFTIAARAVRQMFDQGGGLVVAAKQSGVPLTFRQIQRSGWTYTQLMAVLAARLGGRIRGANVVPGSNVALAAGGPDVDDDELLEIFDRLRDLARRLADDAVWGYVGIRDRFDVLMRDVRVIGRSGVSDYVLDELLFGAHPYQILNPRHLGHFEEIPPGARPLRGNLVEVSVGDPRSWLPDPASAIHELGEPYPRSVHTRNPDIPERAKRLLAPALATRDREQAAYSARYEPPTSPNHRRRDER